MASKKNLHPDLSGIETAPLEERLRTGQLTMSDVEYLLKILAPFARSFIKEASACLPC
jgi:hypothetical protein